MEWFEAFDKYIGVQGVLALLLSVAAVVFVSRGQVIPDEVWTLLCLAWGFYFAKNGSKIVSSAVKRMKKG